MSAFGPLFDLHIKSQRPARHTRGKTARINLSEHEPPTVESAADGRWRLAPIAGLACIILCVLAARLWQLQIIEGATNLSASKRNSVHLKTIPAPRGIVYDRNGAIVARNVPTFSLAVTPILLPKDQAERTRAIARVAELSQIDAKEIQQGIEQAMADPIVPTVLKPGLDRDTEIALLAAKSEIPGFSVEEDLQRSYPLGSALSHVLGYTGSIGQSELESPEFSDYHPGESIGKSGIEQTYEAYLHGERGERLVQINAQGSPQNRQTEKAAVPGNSLTLSIDSELQREASRQLQEAMEKYHTTGAVGVFQDPNTGQVLALVSLPAYDNNAFAKGISRTEYDSLINNPMRPMFDRAVAGTYPPGSMVKPLIGGGAVADGVISRTTIINSPSFINIGSFRYADWTFWLGRPAPGPINVIQAIAQSSDTFFYQLGGGYEQVKGMGVKAIKHYYSQAGFGSLTGIDLPGEAKGVVPDPAWKAKTFPDDPSWYVGNTYQLAIGQSYLLTTPIQINAMTSAIANGGALLRPHLVTRIKDANGHTVSSFGREVIRPSILDKTSIKVAQDGMRESVEHGIVFPFRTNPWPVAAKTGTAEFGTKNAIGEYETHSWVTGYAPFDKPRISFTVLLESGGSSTNAAQVANEILKWYAEKMDGRSMGQ
jgi:penicillin-binding protein 2